MKRVLGEMLAQPVKFWPQLFRHYAYKNFIYFVMPSLLGLLLYRDREKVKMERGYRFVGPSAQTGKQWVATASDPLLEETKMLGQPIGKYLQYQAAALPHAAFALLFGGPFETPDDPFGHLFKLGTPFWRDITTIMDKDKSVGEKIVNLLGIAYTYRRSNQEDERLSAEQKAREALDLYTNWKRHKESLRGFPGESKHTTEVRY